jgi:hypothetical protein
MPGDPREKIHPYMDTCLSRRQQGENTPIYGHMSIQETIGSREHRMGAHMYPYMAIYLSGGGYIEWAQRSRVRDGNRWGAACMPAWSTAYSA